jgi:hypothetical protein
MSGTVGASSCAVAHVAIQWFFGAACAKAVAMFSASAINMTLQAFLMPNLSG